MATRSFRWSIDGGATWNYEEDAELPFTIDGVGANDPVWVEAIGESSMTPGEFDPFTADKIILIGASLVARTFSNSARAAYLDAAAINMGFAGTIDNQATAGDRFDDTLDHLDSTVLPAYESSGDTAIALIHRSGNDVTDNRPYTEDQKDDYRANLNAIFAKLRSVGITCAPANISKRYYTETNAVEYDDPSTDAYGSLPYNQNCVEPWIQDLAPNYWDKSAGSPKIDVYDFIERARWVVTANDGTHILPNTEVGDGYAHIFVEHMLYRLKRAHDNDARAEVSGKKFIFSQMYRTLDPETTGGVNKFARFCSYIQDSDGNAVPNFAISVEGGAAPSNQGAGDSAVVSDADLSTYQNYYIFAASEANETEVRDTFIRIRCMGLPTGATGQITLSGSRDTSGTDRRGEVTVQGVAAGTLDAATDATSNELGPIDFTVNSDGELIIEIVAAEGSEFAYLTAWKLVFD